MAYSYQDFTNALKNAGVNFSQYDLDLAAQNPEAGMQLLQYKIDYNNAGDATMKAVANAGANAIRSQYGNYTGGADGSQYNPLGKQGQSSFSDTTMDLLSQMTNYGSFSGGGTQPTYTNQYKDETDNILNSILTYRDGGFNYNPSEDQNWGNYKKAYLREGERAQANALSGAASLTGGLPSSYAATAASQAGDYYASQLTDKLPELYQQAYNRYLDEYNMKLSDLSSVQSVEQGEYNKYLTDLGQYNTNRDFDYGAWLDQYNMTSNNFNASNSLDQQSAALSADEIERQYQLAELAASYGDLSGLQKLGIDTSAYQAAAAKKGSGGGGGGGGGSVSVPALGTDAWYEYVLAKAAEAGQSYEDYINDSYNYKALGLTTAGLREEYKKKIKAHLGKDPANMVLTELQRVKELVDQNKISEKMALEIMRQYIDEQVGYGNITAAEAAQLKASIEL